MTAQRRQPSVWTVLTPKWRSAFARLREEQSPDRGARAILLRIGCPGVLGRVYSALPTGCCATSAVWRTSAI